MSSQGPPSKQFTVTIVGGGIGGLALAIGLIRRNVPVEIFEAAAAFGEVGLGLSMGPAAHRAMPLIDPHIREIYDSLVTQHSDSPGFEEFQQTWFEIVWASGPAAGEILMNLKAPPSGQTTLRRADFLDALVKLIPEGVAHFGKRLTKLEETSQGVLLDFADGTSTVADVVVGCDGIRSKVKEAIFGSETEHMQPHYSGMYCYRAVLDMETAVETLGERRARISTLYIGKATYAITYPIMRAKKVNVGLHKHSGTWPNKAWVQSVPRDVMEQDFAHMGESVKALMEKMTDTTQWAMFEHPDIPTFCKSRIAILGDAAHASTPHQGAGAGQAIEDAHVLAELLSDSAVTQPEHVITAFQAYDQMRRPRSQKVVATSKENAELLCLSYKGIGDDAEKLKETWDERFRWLWNIDVRQQAEDARRVMLGMMQNVK